MLSILADRRYTIVVIRVAPHTAQREAHRFSIICSIHKCQTGVPGRRLPPGLLSSLHAFWHARPYRGADNAGLEWRRPPRVVLDWAQRQSNVTRWDLNCHHSRRFTMSVETNNYGQ